MSHSNIWAAGSIEFAKRNVKLTLIRDITSLSLSSRTVITAWDAMQYEMPNLDAELHLVATISRPDANFLNNKQPLPSRIMLRTKEFGIYRKVCTYDIIPTEIRKAELMPVGIDCRLKMSGSFFCASNRTAL